MENGLLYRFLGKNMELSIFEDRVELYKDLSMKRWTVPYSIINNVMFRQVSHEKTGFIKVRAQGIMFDFVTYKFNRRDSQQDMQNLRSLMEAAKDEINRRVVARRGLPENTSIITYY